MQALRMTEFNIGFLFYLICAGSVLAQVRRSPPQVWSAWLLEYGQLGATPQLTYILFDSTT